MFPVFLAALRYGIRTRRGRRLLLLGGMHGLRLARSAQARRAYARTWRLATHRAPRTAASRAVRSAVGRVKR